MRNFPGVKKLQLGFNFFKENKPSILSAFHFENSKSSRSRQRGFTLIEVLVAAALIGVLVTVASTIFINTLRNANKANIINEARQNADLVISTLDRDVRKATIAQASSNQLTLTFSDGTSVIWTCTEEASGNNGYIARNGTSLTNKDKTYGVSVTNTGGGSCTAPNGFSVLPPPGTPATQYLVTFYFNLTEGTSVHAHSTELLVNLHYRDAVGTRNH